MTDRIHRQQRGFFLALLALLLVFSINACTRRPLPTATSPAAPSASEPTPTPFPLIPTYTPMPMPK